MGATQKKTIAIDVLPHGADPVLVLAPVAVPFCLEHSVRVVLVLRLHPAEDDVSFLHGGRLLHDAARASAVAASAAMAPGLEHAI
eukprot:6933574-Pyramimonas_sp.AAC.1